MATFSMTMSVGGTTGTQTFTTTDQRMLDFLDDLLTDVYPEIDDGNDGTRPMTRQEVATHHISILMTEQTNLAKHIEYVRLTSGISGGGLE